MTTPASSSDQFAPVPDGRYLDVDGVRTFYIDRGEGDVIVLLHGSSLGIDGYITWFRTIEHLSARFRVISFDQIGFGRTDVPEDGQYLNRLERLEHASRFLQLLGVEHATIVGHSEGGFMATYLALENPELVTRLVVVTSGGVSPTLGGSADNEWMEASNSAYDYAGQSMTEDHFIATSAYLKRAEDPSYEAVLRENFRLAQTSGQTPMMLNLPAEETDPRLYVSLQEKHVLPRLAELHLPVLLIWASDDPTVPVARGAKLMELIPQADMHVFNRAGHMVMHDRAEDFATLLAKWCR
ncbi:MAG: alpha/beta hydrolase [Pseudomonadota bacterium]